MGIKKVVMRSGEKNFHCNFCHDKHVEIFKLSDEIDQKMWVCRPCLNEVLK